MDFFEGTEKLLEIWFTRSSESECDSNDSSLLSNSDCSFDLRSIPREEIDELLNLVNCKVLSYTKSKDLDSYVLSESSLFINKNRLMLKTCGTTTLLDAVGPIIETAFKYSGYDTIQDLFYSRKKFMRPDLQKKPHNSFEDEVHFLEKMLGGGTAYILGKHAMSECWYMYTLNKPVSIEEGDQTLEIIMTNLDQDIMNIFTKNVSSSAEEATRLSKIDQIFPNAMLDGYLFDPCGYSVNAILPKGHYFTIHITPEPTCSYVSFETDVPEKDYTNLIRKVVSLFKPKQFIVTFFANDNSIVGTFNKRNFRFKDYQFESYQERRVKNYNLVYAQYSSSRKHI